RPPLIPFGAPLQVKGVSFLRLDKIGGQSGDTEDGPTIPGLIVKVVNRLNLLLKPKPYDGPQTSISATQPNMNSLLSISSAAPAYFCGATQTDHIVQGCPLSPPIPVPADLACSSSPGFWPFSLPGLPDNLQTMN